MAVTWLRFGGGGLINSSFDVQYSALVPVRLSLCVQSTYLGDLELRSFVKLVGDQGVQSSLVLEARI